MRRAFLGCLLLAALAACQPRPAETSVIYFSPMKSDLDAPARKVVADVAAMAAQRPNAVVTVDGYAAAAPSGSAALQISAARARAVQDALVAAGVAPARIIRHANGEVDYSLDTVESRRVVITLGGK